MTFLNLMQEALKGGEKPLIDINDFNYSKICDFGGEYPKDNAKHSIGMANAPADLRLNVCHQCLKEIISAGLKRLTEGERAEILRAYLPQQPIKEQEEQRERIENEQYAEGEEHKEETKEASDTKVSYRDELITKAKVLGVEGKLVTFSNKKLEREIKNKLGGK